MYGLSKFRRRLDWLDDRMSQLQSIDWAIKHGRVMGELHQMGMESYYRGHSPKPPKYERTPEYRLMKHYERLFRRIQRGQIEP